MEENFTYKTPKDTLLKMQVIHLGKITFNLQFILLAIMLAGVLTFIMPAIYYLMLICVAFLSLFTLFANPNFKALWSGGETLTKVAEFFVQSWKFTVPIAMVLSIITIVCLLFDKSKKHTAKIAISVIIVVIAAVILVAKFINGGGVWQKLLIWNLLVHRVWKILWYILTILLLPLNKMNLKI